MITFSTPKHHWNYFLALEKDLETMSRYIEFSEDNLSTYSIELTHILLSASSEVDVIIKQLCNFLDKTKKPENINDYKAIIKKQLGSFIDEEISLDRFSLKYKPWENWLGNENPNWWRSYNNVKHQRNDYFREANLQNTINAVGALLITVVYYYKYAFMNEAGDEISFRDTTIHLQPNSTFLKINSDYYYDLLTLDGVPLRLRTSKPSIKTK